MKLDKLMILAAMADDLFAHSAMSAEMPYLSDGVITNPQIPNCQLLPQGAL